jgi:hypothetical protein
MKEKGCFTQDKYIAGRSLKEIENILGFQERRLSRGAIVVALIELPRKGQFRVAGYTNVSLHNFEMPKGLDRNVLEKNAMEQWELQGRNRLVKVKPVIEHDPTIDSDIQYPHAYGAPQWEVLVDLPCIQAGDPVSGYPDGIYRPRY